MPEAPDRQELLTALTTEHFTLQGARSQTAGESASRASLYILSVSSTLVALGFIGQASQTGSQRAPRHPRRQRARPRSLCTNVRQPGAATEQRSIHLSRSALPRLYVDWNKAAGDTVAVLRAPAGRDLHDRRLSDLVRELSTQSDEFRTRWAPHNVRQHITGIKHFHHPVVGDLSLTYDRLDLVADPGLTIFTYTAEPGSRDEETLRLLGSWAATLEEHAAAQITDAE